MKYTTFGLDQMILPIYCKAIHDFGLNWQHGNYHRRRARSRTLNLPPRSNDWPDGGGKFPTARNLSRVGKTKTEYGQLFALSSANLWSKVETLCSCSLIWTVRTKERGWSAQKVRLNAWLGAIVSRQVQRCEHGRIRPIPIPIRPIILS